MPGPFQDRGHGKSMDRIAMTFFVLRGSHADCLPHIFLSAPLVARRHPAYDG